MSKSFGTKFIISNDVVQYLNPKIFGGGPWLHLATLHRGFKEYMCFKHVPTDQTYIEEFDPKNSYPFKKIKNDNEFSDIHAFLKDAGILDIKIGGEIKIARKA